MQSPDDEQRERQANGARGGNPGADLLWQLIGITLAGIALAVAVACLL